jgi:hypothetical protein
MGNGRFDGYPALLAVMLLASFAALAKDESLGKDLKATIVLQGFPCDQIISSKRNGDSDYVATCKDGNSYHVFVNSQGRVIVQKR